MKTAQDLKGRTVSGLRTRFIPRSRIGQGLVSMGPWIDIVLLIIFFLLLNSKLVLQPGTVVELPRARFRDGTHSGMVAVVLSVSGTSQRDGEDIVFFDDERFLFGNAEQKRNLQQAFAKRTRERPDTGLIIQADKNVAYGTVVDIMNMALDVGVEQVNLAVRPSEP